MYHFESVLHGWGACSSEEVSGGCCAALGADGLPNLTALPLRERLAAAQRFVAASMAAPRTAAAGYSVAAAAQWLPPSAHPGSAGRSVAAPQQLPPVAAGSAGYQPRYAAQAAPPMLTSVPVLPGGSAAPRGRAPTPAQRRGVFSVLFFASPCKEYSMEFLPPSDIC